VSLVLSVFPGIGLLDMAFEEEGFCVVRGPDLLWGGDVRRFHAPHGVFAGVIGGPPCQVHSAMGDLNPLAGRKHGDMIPEFDRIVLESGAEWFVRENVQQAPVAVIPDYSVDVVNLDNRALGEEQQRKRTFCFGSTAGLRISPFIAEQVMGVAENPVRELVVLAGHGPAMGQRVRGIEGRDWKTMARLQGIPAERVAILEAEKLFTVHGFKKVIGNGVPLPMGRAVARAVKRALAGVEVS
jgi:DNA (cytosine-5)-methyltransferase 1